MTYKLLTYNIRYDNRFDGQNRFTNRLPIIFETLNELDPDIICFQEVTRRMFEKLEPLLLKYNYTGEYRDETKAGEANFILTKKDKFELLESKTLWLSPNPDVPGSRYPGDQSNLPRVITKARYKTSDNKVINIFNTHFDYLGKQSRLNSANQIIDYIKKITDEPLILTGDFNDYPTSEPIKIISNHLNDLTINIPVSFHEFNKNRTGVKIDYIFINHLVNSGDGKIVEYHDQSKFLSDHHPILISFNI